MLKNVCYFSLFVLATSCAYHVGNISTGSYIDCPLRYIATGTSKTVKVLGLGSLDRDALIVEAKQDLYSKYPYSKTTKLSNFAVDYKVSFLVLFISTKVTVSADVYDCDSLAGKSLGQAPKDLSMTIGGLQKGDSILYNPIAYTYKGIFLQYANNGKYEIQYKDDLGKMLTKTVKPNLVFKTTKDPYNKSYYGFEIGEEASIEVFNREKEAKTKRPCTILGINATSAIITYTKDNGSPRSLTVKKSALKK